MSTLSGKNQNVPLPSGREKGGKGAGPRTTNPADLPLPMGPSFTVARGDLVRAITRAARRAGVVVLCAPRGFGKTALLLQYADEVRRDPGRGSARIVDARGALPEELLLQIEEAETECPAAVRPLVAIDNLPVCDDEAYRMLAQRIREMRDRDTEVLIACEPASRGFMRQLGDSEKFTARQLLVHPREYPDWSRVFSISGKLDVYGLTQGVPALVAALQAAGPESVAPQPLDSAVYTLYWCALDELARSDEPLYRMACELLLIGEGNAADFAAAGIPLSIADIQRLMHDYPIFGYDAATGNFSCLGGADGACRRIRGLIAEKTPQLVRRAARVQLRAGRVDQAVALLEEHLDSSDALHIIARHPVLLPLAGHAAFVNKVIGGRESQPEGRDADASVKLAAYASALVLGDFRLARTMAGELALRLDEVQAHVDPRDWNEARSLGLLWDSCRGVVLPEYPTDEGRRTATKASEALELHRRSLVALVERGEWTGEVERFLERNASSAIRHGMWRTSQLQLPLLFLHCDALLAEALTGALGHIDVRDSALARVERTLRERRLGPTLCFARLVCSLRRLLAGSAIVDEQAFVDANTLAVRTSDLTMQLFCTICEGWQDLTENQPSSARFRGQQAMKLSAERQPLLARAAMFLERVANMRSVSRFALREEAGALDLNNADVSVEEAWAAALYLSATRSEAELTAWYSFQKDRLLTPSFRLFARLAMSVMGDQADAMHRLLPARLLPYYLMGNEEAPVAAPLFQVVGKEGEDRDVGQVVFRLLGGFSIERNGHVLTSSIWKRKKAGLLAARLALAQGGLVNRQVLWDEFWPKADYARARESLYSAVSVLRRAFGQSGKGGPQYLLLQGDGIGINEEFVTSDVKAFEDLARLVLLGHLHMSAPKVIELCLRIEQLYAGPLFVPDEGPVGYFERMRRTLQSKFIDCMIRGIDVAIEEEDMNAALWMAEAGLQQDGTREDLLRRAMCIYERLGRRKDVVELYGTHVRSLEMRAKGDPEPETRQLYNDILERGHVREIL